MNVFGDDDGDDERKKRRSPFDLFDSDEEFKRMFQEMERMMQRAFQNFPFDNMQPGKSFVHGFNIHIGPNGKPRIREFGNRSLKSSDGKREISEQREPLTDIIEGKDDVAVTIEIPGVEKQDINLTTNEDTLEVEVDSFERKYHRVIDLPCDVQPPTTKATYKNGVLDVVIKRKKKKSSDDGFHVTIE